MVIVIVLRSKDTFQSCESIIYISAFSCCISSADSPVISITVASSMPFVSIFLAISRLFFSIPSAIPSRLAVSTEFLMSRYAILLASYSLNSCGVYLSSTYLIRISFYSFVLIRFILLQRYSEI